MPEAVRGEANADGMSGQRLPKEEPMHVFSESVKCDKTR
jgi:hypothetical protein